MKRHAHWWMSLLFLVVLAYDFATWGALARLPDIGTKVQVSARREALLATIYMQAGNALDAAVPPLDSWGSRNVEMILAEGFPRIKDDPSVAIDLIFSQTWNVRHAILKVMYWAAPALAIVTLFFWARRPKKVSLMGSGR